MIRVRKTFDVDAELLERAKRACGAATDAETIRLGLAALAGRDAYERLRSLLGTEPKAKDVPRRRENPSTRKRSVA